MQTRLPASLALFLVAGVSCFFSDKAVSATFYDQLITPDVLFGSGNTNGSFTVDRVDTQGGPGLELGLRGKLRFNDNNQPENTFNSNGDGSYTFHVGTPPTGFGFDAGSPTTPVWNFEWSINTAYLSSDEQSTVQLDDFTYELRLDADPTVATNFMTFDLINDDYYDHAIGNNLTGNGAGMVAADPTEYALLIAEENVAQNSWSYEFFNDPGSPLENFDPNQAGTYTIELEAFDRVSGLSAGLVSIDIQTIPEPGTLGIASLAGLFGTAVYLRRRWE